MEIGIHAPNTQVFLVSLVIALLAMISFLLPIPYVTPIAHWVGLLAYVVLAFGSVVKT